MRNKNILIYTQWPFFDGLTLSYVLPFIRIIRKHIPAETKVYLVTQEKKPEQLLRAEPQDIINKMREENIFLVPEKYYNLGIKKYLSFPLNFFKLLRLVFSKQIGIIHTQAMSAGMIGCILSWLTGKMLIVDSYEPLSESMIEGNIWRKNSLAYKLVFYFEKKQAQRASYIIACTNEMKTYAKKTYNINLQNFYWKPACVDMEQFRFNETDRNSLRKKYNLEDNLVAIYVGKFGSQYLETEVFDFFVACKNYWGEKFKVLILTSHSDEELKYYCKKSGFNFNDIVKEFVAHSEVKKYLSVADFALTPVKPLPSKRYCTPIKDGEYWSVGLPVVITENISDDSDVIEDNNIGTVIRTYDANAYLQAIEKINELLQEPREKLRERITSVCRKTRHYDIADEVYKSVYKNIFK
jgi:glycosyltransferase involved in cell wall biosynthesis